MRTRPLLILLAVLGLVLAGCGDDDADGGDSADDPSSEPSADVQDDDGDLQDAADDLAEDLEDLQEAEGGGGATLTVGDQTFEFGSVLCAMGEDETGQEGAELVVSATADGLQFYVSIDSFGNSISIDDISDFENPSVSLSANELAPGDSVEITVDGKEVSGSSDAFRDSTAETLDTLSGSFEATCP